MTRISYLVIGIIFGGLFYLVMMRPLQDSHPTQHPKLHQKMSLNAFPPPEEIHSKNQRGPLRAIVFLASWCHHCPDVLKMLKEKTNLTLWVMRYHDQKPISNLIRNGAHHIYDAPATLGPEWGLRGVPEIFVVDPKGNLIWHKAGRLQVWDLQSLKTLEEDWQKSE